MFDRNIELIQMYYPKSKYQNRKNYELKFS